MAEIAIGSPVYNFTISWPLKAWLHQIVRMGKTSGYGENSPIGLLKMVSCLPA
jgi:FMN-dependent NADH-azoreductase